MEWGTKESDDSERILSNYIFGQTLGSGTFAKVKLAQHILTGHQVAVKILKRKSMTNEEIEKGIIRLDWIQICSTMNTSNIFNFTCIYFLYVFSYQQGL